MLAQQTKESAADTMCPPPMENGVKMLQHKAWYTLSCLQKYLSFQYEPSKRLPVPSQQLEQSLKYVQS